MKSRLLVAAIGIPLILWIILWAPAIVLEAMIWLLAGIGAFELMKCINANKGLRLGTGCASALVLLTASAFGQEFYIPAVMGCGVLFFSVAVWRAGQIKWVDIATAIFAITAIPYALSAFLRLHEAGFPRAFLLLPLIFSFASDTGAFFAGLTFGKHKLAPKVSPKKTVEGAIGGLFGNAIGGITFAYVMNSFFAQNIDYLLIALLGVICSIVAQLGDLSFSLIKREYGIKDYGTLFLAHGGVLDRFDSVIFVAPVLSALMIAFL